MPDVWDRVEEQATRLMWYEERVDSLFDAIKHGSEDHRSWLKEAIDCHFENRKMPEYRE